MTKIFRNSSELGRTAADAASAGLRETIARQGRARIIAATGASQSSFRKELTGLPGIDWRQVKMFHRDGYVGLPMTHGASFRRHLTERLIKPAGIERYHLLDGEGDVTVVCRRAGAGPNAAPVDLSFGGIGENGHLAFNDPPTGSALTLDRAVANTAKFTGLPLETVLPMTSSQPAKYLGVQPSVRVTADWDATECRLSMRDVLDAV